jgi:DNA-binding transcriptional LysR family regulator
MMNLALVNLRELQRLIALVKHKSYVRAADEMGITQSALTRSIQALEAQFSVRLLDRDRGGVRLTPAGRRFLEDAEALLHHAGEFARRMSTPDDGRSGRVAMGFAPHAAPLYLPHLLRELIEDCPRLKVRAEVQNAGSLFPLLARGDIEFVVCGESQVPDPVDFDLTPLKAVPVAVLARKGHPLARKNAVSIADLHAYPRISGRRIEDQALVPGDADLPTISCDDFGVLRAMAVGTDSVWLGPSLSWLDAAARDQLIELSVRPEDAGPPLPLLLLTARRRSLSAQARQVIDRIVRMSAEL